jgi:hypothetical protein
MKLPLPATRGEGWGEGPRLLILLTLWGCPKSPDTDVRSTSLATVKERISALCNTALCPTQPLDAAFHIYTTDEGTVVHAVAKIDPLDAPQWSMGCDHFPVEARPKWVSEVIGPTGWKVKTTPDLWRCGGERRVIHVKEGLVIRALLRTE